MSLKLILIRHCKSSWGAFDADDHARVLNERGRTAAPLIGEWLSKRRHVPDEVMCSDAARTQETWRRISGAMVIDAPINYSRALYLAPDLLMLEHLRKATSPTVALVGHNPGIGELALGLVRDYPEHDRFAEYPTGATTVMTFEVDSWADVKEETGEVIDFTVPRDL